MDEEIIEKHESYGVLGFYRTSSTTSNLFGSSIKHQNTIRMRLKTASKRRRLNDTRYYGDKDIVEVEMSYNQFAEIITSMNVGDGVPVTIKRLNGQRMEECPDENIREVFEKEFAQKMKELGSRMNKLVEESEKILSDKNPLKKNDKELILSELRMLKQELSSNVPFVASQFNEQMDKTVAEAKGEVEAFVMNKVHSLGIEGLKMEMLALNDGKQD